MADRSAAEIEREIERERAELSRKLDGLTDRFSVDGIVRSATDTMRENAGELGSGVAKTLRENPVATAILGAGIAYLIFGGKSAPGPATTTPAPAQARTKTPAPVSQSAPKAQKPEKTPPAPKSIREATSADQSAADLLDHITDGTDTLSEAARERVIRARIRAYEAQRRAEDGTAAAAAMGANFYERQPLVVGAMAVAAGALMGGLLPSLRRDSAGDGAYREFLLSEAQRVLDEETGAAPKTEAADDGAEKKQTEPGKAQARDTPDPVAPPAPEKPKPEKAADAKPEAETEAGKTDAGDAKSGSNGAGPKPVQAEAAKKPDAKPSAN